MPRHAVVELVDKFANGGVEFGQREELPVPECCQDPALGNLNGHFDLGFIAWLVRSCRHHRGIIVGCQIGISAIDRWFMETSFGDARLEIVAYDLGGDAAEKIKRPDMRTRPVGKALRHRRFSKGVARRAEASDEQLRHVLLTGQSCLLYTSPSPRD